MGTKNKLIIARGEVVLVVERWVKKVKGGIKSIVSSVVNFT